VVLAAISKLTFVVWTVTGPIGGASPALSNATLSTPSIALNVGKMDHSKTSHYLIWTMFLFLDTQGWAVSALTMEICLEIAG
jgi:hypothetical protein